MFCGTCLHDNTLAAALKERGEEILLVPTYTPIRTDEKDQSEERIRFGGINVYLQQYVGLFRHTPWFLDRILDSPRLIRWLTGRAAKTDASQLGGLTVSMLQGEDGYQKKELDKLIHWLATDVRPDLVHLSNSMLSGMARQITRQLGIPVVCSLMGEDVFLDRLQSPYLEQARAVLQDRIRDVVALVSMNRYFADYMAEYLQVDRQLIEVIPHGLNLQGHGTRRASAAGEDRVIGYFARIHPDKGLHHLANAFCILAKDPTIPPIRLKAAGYMAPTEEEYLNEIRQKLERAGVLNRFEYLGEVDRQQKIEFLQSLDVMSVPTVYKESKGLSVLEAMANAVPVVLPAHGVFPELIEDTQGGLLFYPEDPQALAHELKKVITNPLLAEQLGRAGQAAIHDRYSADLMAERTLSLYRRVLEDWKVRTKVSVTPVT